MADYQIRAIRLDDIATVVQLCREHAEFEQAEYRDTGQAERLRVVLFDENPALSGVVVEFDGALVGYATYMRQYATWDAAYYLYLDCLYLRPEARQQGLGKALMLHIQQIAQEWQCIHIQWQTPIFNENAIGFYRHLGAVDKPKIRFFLAAD